MVNSGCNVIVCKGGYGLLLIDLSMSYGNCVH